MYLLHNSFCMRCLPHAKVCYTQRNASKCIKNTSECCGRKRHSIREKTTLIPPQRCLISPSTRRGASSRTARFCRRPWSPLSSRWSCSSAQHNATGELVTFPFCDTVTLWTLRCLVSPCRWGRICHMRSSGLAVALSAMSHPWPGVTC